MTFTRHSIQALIMAMMLLALPAMAGNTTISAKLDSTHVLMGKTIGLHISVVQDREVNGLMLNLVADTLNAKVEIADKGKADTTALDNNRLQINRDVTLQAFDPGTYQLPAILYVVGGDTLRSKETLTLTVDSIKVDPQGKIKDFKPVAEAPFKLLDWVPDFISDYWWAWLAGLLLLAFGLYAYFKWYKKGINPLKPVKKRLPPYEEAMQALSNLKSRNLWQNGQEKEYYTTLTDILRVYIDRRFGINAVEMTSTQIMDKIRQNEDAHIAKEQLNNVLEIADFVKFANMHTLADDNEIAFQRAVNFVEQTKPLPQPNEEDGKEDAQ
ncbi:MAG: cell wall anchor protein [Muribaculaceae bacterium]|nr:cell wall anchor protein [Muribaculaceae bacterium]MDY6293496.1 cell wall anchor protein [Bacteroidales bacterium]